MGIISTLLWALITDVIGKRWVSGYYVAITAICVGIILLIPSMSVAGQFAAFYWSGTIYCIQATFFAWANDTMRYEPVAFRAVVIACMNFGGNVFQAWWPLVFYRADDAPKFTVSNHNSLPIISPKSATGCDRHSNRKIAGYGRYGRYRRGHGDLGNGYALHGEAAR